MRRAPLALLGAAAAATFACAVPRSTRGARDDAAAEPLDASSAPDAGAEARAPLDASSRDDGPGDAEASVTRAVLHVPQARAPFTPQGHFRIGVWEGAPSTGTLRDRAGQGAVPVSEARFLWRDRALYLFFYAGDLDLEAHAARHDGPIWKDDSVELAFGGQAKSGASCASR